MLNNNINSSSSNDFFFNFLLVCPPVENNLENRLFDTLIFANASSHLILCMFNFLCYCCLWHFLCGIECKSLLNFGWRHWGYVWLFRLNRFLHYYIWIFNVKLLLKLRPTYRTYLWNFNIFSVFIWNFKSL